VVAGDFNNHVYWDKPGWRMNHANEIAALSRLGLISAYHEARDIGAGEETDPTIYWRDRTWDGPSYHIDYIFMRREWTCGPFRLDVGGFDDWVASGLSDHVPLTLEVAFKVA
jgi:endonuclease/exonuclease/phosphatase family metal-dependent hydrolase